MTRAFGSVLGLALLAGWGCTAGQPAPSVDPTAAVADSLLWWPAAPPPDPWRPVAALVLPTGGVVIAETAQNRLFLLADRSALPFRLPAPGRTVVEWTALAPAPGLSFYALDGPGRRLHQYDLQGNYLGIALDLEALAANEGLGPVEPAGLAVDAAGHGVITDRLGDRLLVFGPGWSFLGVWGQSGSEPGSWRRPEAVAVGKQGPFLVADTGNRRLVLLDGLGEVLAVRPLEAAPRGVAVVGTDHYAVSIEARVEGMGAGLRFRSATALPAAPCPGGSYATPALAGTDRLLIAGEGCSGRVLQLRPGGD